MKRLAILGASGHGKVVADIAVAIGWEFVVFFDDAWPSISSNGHWLVEGDTQCLIGRKDQFDGVIVAIGNCRTRLKLQTQLETFGCRIVTLVHPSACVSQFASVGVGSVVMPGVVINAFAVVGRACIINSGATVDHDDVLADGVHIAPGANISGGVSVGECSWIGVGAAVKQGVSIGSDVTVGVGSVVVMDIADGVTVVGNPAKPLDKLRC